MTLQLEIVSEHREIVGDDAIREFREEGGTIGRSLENDWILPDPDRYISSRHATIDCKGGVYYLADTSSNGVYINDEYEPVGKNKPRRLFNGDRLRMGDFEIVVSIDSGESLELPAAAPPTVVPDNIEQLVPEEELKTGILLLDEEEITGDEAFESVLRGQTPEKLPVLPVEDIPPEPAPVAKPATEPSRIEFTGQDLFDSFLDGLGINRSELHPSIDVSETMRNAGEVLREYVSGTDKLLASRANLKASFRLDRTSILPQHNNPLKLSQNSNDSIKQLLVGQEGEYLGPRDSVREVCRDLLAHQEAFLGAMTAAFTEFAAKFDPDELADSFRDSIGRGALFGFMKNGKYWELYNDFYPVLTDTGGGRFPQTFSEEFVKAYEKLVSESRHGVHGMISDKPAELAPLSEDDLDDQLDSFDDDDSVEEDLLRTNRMDRPGRVEG